MIYPFILLSLAPIAGANFFSSDPFQFSTSCDPNLETTTTEVAETSTTVYHPMAWDFKDSTHSLTQDTWFNELFTLTTNGLPPIHYPRNDSTADYSGELWRDSCYERFQSQTRCYFVIFWEIEGEMYCEVYCSYFPIKRQNPTFEMKYLTRVETLGNGCV